MRSGSRTSEGWVLGFSGEPGSEKESRTWDVQVISELGFVGVRSGGLSRGLGAVESWEQGLSWAVGSWVASWGGERRRGWGSVREELGSPLLLGSAEAVEDWDGEMISGLASEGSWEVGCFEVLVASEGWGVCRGGRPTERDRGWGPGGFSSSACHLHLPGMSGWVGMERWARCWPLNEGGAGRLDEQMGEGWGGALTRLWQQSKLWLGRRLLFQVAVTLRLSRISLSKSSSSPDPRKLPSRASSANGPWASSGLREGVLGEDGQPQVSAPDQLL